ncbi:hypothetical protein EDB83DRAFT_2322393 [Lactarius deliciosus]|nr:hypothetical protein EDB83DRAFT_2322393 [Lactarius deliciosus]
MDKAQRRVAREGYGSIHCKGFLIVVVVVVVATSLSSPPYRHRCNGQAIGLSSFATGIKRDIVMGLACCDGVAKVADAHCKSEREVGIEICARETIIGHESLVLREIGPHTVSKPPNVLDTEAVEKIWQDGCCTREAHVPAVHAKKTSGARQHGGCVVRRNGSCALYGAEVRVSLKAEGIPQGLQRDRGGTESEAFATAIAGANANGRRRERVWMDEARPRQENDAVRSGETSREDERGKPRCNFRVRASGLNTNENRSYFRQVGTKEAGAEANDNEGEAKGMGLEMGDATETGLEDKDDTRRGNAWPVFECRLASSIREGDSRTSGGRSNERREEGERERECVCVYTHEGERECNRWGAIRHDGVAVVASFREREEAQALQRRDINGGGTGRGQEPTG